MIPKWYILKTTDGKRHILSTYLNAIDEVVVFMRKVIYGDENYFKAAQGRNGKPMKLVSATGQYLTRLGHYLEIYSADYTYSPLLGFFFEQFRAHPSSLALVGCGKPLQFDIDLFDDLLAKMRRDALQSNLKKKVADWESKAKSNMDSLNGFESALFKRCSRLVVVRLDLHHKKVVFSLDELDAILQKEEKQKFDDIQNLLAGREISQGRALEGNVSLEDLKHNLKRLMTNIKGKPSLFRHLVGYAWCIEFARVAGYHAHMVLFFDGQYVEKHEHYAHEVGQYWMDTVTHGQGYYYNCNLDKDRHGSNWALGVINHWDHEKRQKLRANVLKYFCKTSQMVQVLPYPGCRLFGKGFVRRLRPAKSGRPRIKG